MSRYMDAYTAYLSANGDTDRERHIKHTRDDFLRHAPRNPSYHDDTLRNGKSQPLLVIRGEEPFQCKVVTMPGDGLDTGDYIEAFGQTWLVKEARVDDTMQLGGVIWLCNHCFRFQAARGGPIVERWGVFDTGVYSTTQRREKELTVLDKQFRVWLPYDEQTKLLYEDKRLAVGTTYDKNGRETLSVFRITGRDTVGRSFGVTSHLLALDVRSDQYNEANDSFELGVCDYTDIADDPETPDLPDLPGICRIDGADTLREGAGSISLTAGFLRADGTPDEQAQAVWTLEPAYESISAELNGVELLLSAARGGGLAGKSFVVRCRDEQGAYDPAEHEVKVVWLL